MKLELKRKWLTANSSIGELTIDGEFECYVLEDVFRPPWEPKVYGRTAIPCGTFRVVVTQSPRFGVEMPLLLDVPGFEGVRIHAGNKPQDTEGCLLPGLDRGGEAVFRSREAFGRLMAKFAMRPEEKHSITIITLFT